ncbi:DUF5819 family protein [Microlunatus sp. GCM10028923]|uniref:DUF5819 family protein n=1 Tax=Microlunatus sp. GCM10028923 TaxID=3273400 RepID=UPI00360F31C4
MKETTEQMSRGRGRRTRWIKPSVVGLLCAFTAWHILATFLWIAPPSAIRQVVPGNLLSTYMLPMFGQSWSVFAPVPINGDHKLEVRATLGTGKSARTTEWIDATRAEFSMLQRHLFPPRAAIMASQTATEVKQSWEKLSEEQKKVAALGFYSNSDWESRLKAGLGIRPNLTKTSAARYAKADHVATAYATQVAYAMWGDEVSAVQFRVTRQNVVPFKDRDVPGVEPPAPQIVPTGWRGTIEEPGQSRSQFRETFRRAVWESGQ